MFHPAFYAESLVNITVLDQETLVVLFSGRNQGTSGVRVCKSEFVCFCVGAQVVSGFTGVNIITQFVHCSDLII